MATNNTSSSNPRAEKMGDDLDTHALIAADDVYLDLARRRSESQGVIE